MDDDWFKPYIEAMTPRENLLRRLFAKYCNDHRLTDSQIEELAEMERQKEFHNARELQCGTVKVLDGRIDSKFTKLMKFEGDYLCLIPACQEHTNLVVGTLEGLNYIFLCPKHYEDFHAYASSHDPKTW